LCYIYIRVGIYPFSEEVDDNQIKPILVVSLQIDWSYDIQPPYIKMLRRGHIE